MKITTDILSAIKFFFFKQKTAYEITRRDWSSDVCSSDLGVDDRGMLAASGVNVQLVFALTFAIGAGLAGLAGVVGGTALSISPGEDTRYLLASLVVVIVGGMGSVVGASLGALLIGLAEQFGLAYAPTYSVVFTFVIMVVALAFRPRGI